MKTVLITGANKGIGLETARQLLEKGYYVYLGCRDLQKGLETCQKLRKDGLINAEAIQLDVTLEDSIQSAYDHIASHNDKLDVLINNAGINGGPPYTALDAKAIQFKNTFDTNVFGVARMVQSFIDLLKLSPEPRIVNVSTSVGSLSLQSDPLWPAYEHAKFAVYGASKAAMNMYTVHLAYELRNTNFKVNAVCPGYTSTDFTGQQGGDVSIAAARIIKYVLIDSNGPSGKFFSEESNPETGEISW